MSDGRRDDGWEAKCIDDEAQKLDRVATLRSMRRPRPGRRVARPALAQELETLKALVVAQDGELRELRATLAPASGSRLDAFLERLGAESDDSPPRKLSPGLLAALSAGDDGE